MKVLVTGGAGFIGSFLCERLLKDGHYVVCLDNLSTGKIENIRRFKKNFKFVKMDVNVDDLKELFRKNRFDWVFHYAAVVGVRRTLQFPLDVLKDIDGTRNILELSKIYDVKKVIFASSSEVYGSPVEFPESEEGHVNPKIPYAVGKLMGETYLKAYYEKYGLKTCSLRLFNVYGPGQDSTPYGFVSGIFIKQVLQNKPPAIFGDGTQTRDFIFIEDNINAAIVAAKSNKANGKCINIGTGRPITILDLAETIIRLSGKDLKPIFRQARPYEIKHRFPDISKMRKILKFKSKISLEEGLRRTIRYYKSK